MATITITHFDIEEGRAGASRNVHLRARSSFSSAELLDNSLYHIQTEILGHDNGRQPDVRWSSSSFRKATDIHNDEMILLDEHLSSSILNEDSGGSTDGPKDEIRARVTISPFSGGTASAISHIEQDRY